VRTVGRIAIVAAFVAVSTLTGAAQIGGKLVIGGNPTPGTEQPEPPNLADRITLTGCLQTASVRGGGSLDPPTDAKPPVDGNTPTDARFMLANAERIDRVPADTGGSPATTSGPSRSYRLMGIESQFSPFVGTKVEISGEIKPAPSSDDKAAPTLIVEFVQKLALSCK
jgi:hypothetical protein